MTQTPPGWPDNRPPAGWSPTPLGSDGTHLSPDPRQPLGAGRPDSVNISAYAPPRSKAPWFIGLAVALAAALIAVGATLPTGFFGPPAPSASPATTQTQSPTLPGQPFGSSDSRVQGRWAVRDHHWTDSGVEVEIWLAVDEGNLLVSFAAFANDDADGEVIYPQPGQNTPVFEQRRISAGEERTGWLFLPARHSDLTLLLSGEWSQGQLSALIIKG